MGPTLNQPKTLNSKNKLNLVFSALMMGPAKYILDSAFALLYMWSCPKPSFIAPEEALELYCHLLNFFYVKKVILEFCSEAPEDINKQTNNTL